MFHSGFKVFVNNANCVRMHHVVALQQCNLHTDHDVIEVDKLLIKIY